MRGAPVPALAGPLGKRIIPADAGSTRYRSRSMRPGRDHPRRCGEHWSHPDEVKQTGGSSPQMWGARTQVRNHHHVYRIIPADAGSTMAGRAVSICPRDHPRRCGEHRPRGTHRFPHQGSSPQMRGAPPRPRFSGQGRGIIPADAGSTYHPPLCLRERRDHPRRCGEHTISLSAKRIGMGSSPQMRGAPSR